MQTAAYIMSILARGRLGPAALCAAAIAFSARADSPADYIVTRVSAEVLAHPVGSGPTPSPKLQVAERVVPGDVLIYTVEVRNTGQYSVESAIVIQPIPKHTMYVAESAVGPGVDVDYSIDGGQTFAKPDSLKSPNALTATAAGAQSSTRTTRATVAEYTHIRWRLHNRLKPKSIAFVRFRAQVK
jgi:uncharacterized repeat protein (TIGR01451 family)